MHFQSSCNVHIFVVRGVPRREKRPEGVRSLLEALEVKCASCVRVNLTFCCAQRVEAGGCTGGGRCTEGGAGGCRGCTVG